MKSIFNLLFVTLAVMAYAQQEAPHAPWTPTAITEEAVHHDAPIGSEPFVTEAGPRGTYYRATAYSEYDYDSGTMSYEPNDSSEYMYNADNSTYRTNRYMYDDMTALWKRFERTTYSYPGDTLIFLNESWDDINSQWQNNSRQTVIINSFGMWEYSLYENWNGSAWQSSSEYIYEYNAQGKQTLYEYSSGNPLTPVSRYEYTYDASGTYLLEWVYKTWNSGLLTWVKNSRTTTEYDADNNPVTYTNYNWNDIDSKWDPSNRTLNTYDANGNNTRYQSQSYNSMSMQWENTSLYTYTFNTQNLETKRYQFSWNGADWDTTARQRRQYDGDGNLTFRQNDNYDLMGNTWIPVRRYNYTYVNGNETTSLVEDFDDITMQWNGYDRDETTYDTNNNKTQHIDFSWISMGGFFESNYRERWWWESYQTGVGVTDITMVTGVKVFPMPATDVVNISLDSEQGGEAIFEVFDLSGRMMYRKTGIAINNGENLLQWKPMQAGAYLYHITLNGEHLGGKIMVQ